MMKGNKVVKVEEVKEVKEVVNEGVKEVKKVMDKVESVVNEKKNVVSVGNGDKKVEYEVDNKRVKEIIKESEGNKSKMIRELKKEFNMRNSGIKKVLMSEGIIVREQMISNVVINMREKEEFKGKES